MKDIEINADLFEEYRLIQEAEAEEAGTFPSDFDPELAFDPITDEDIDQWAEFWAAEYSRD